MNVIYVGIGGCIGAIFRYLISIFSNKIFTYKLPVGTLIANILGAILIGAIMQITIKTDIISPQMKLFLTTGIMGGLTTFSTFSYETMSLIEKGNITLGFTNIILNLFLSLGGVYIGEIIINKIL